MSALFSRASETEIPALFSLASETEIPALFSRASIETDYRDFFTFNLNINISVTLFSFGKLIYQVRHHKLVRLCWYSAPID